MSGKGANRVILKGVMPTSYPGLSGSMISSGAKGCFDASHQLDVMHAESGNQRKHDE
jgi:hypothetical protein